MELYCQDLLDLFIMCFRQVIISFQGVDLKVYWFENPCFVLQIDVCCGAVLMIMVSTLDTRWKQLELLHQCLAEDSGPTAEDPAAEATVQHPVQTPAWEPVPAADADAEPSAKKAAAKRSGVRS